MAMAGWSLLSSSVKLLSAATSIGSSLLRISPSMGGFTLKEKLELKSLERSVKALIPPVNLCFLREQNHPSHAAEAVNQALEILKEILSFFSSLNSSHVLTGKPLSHSEQLRTQLSFYLEEAKTLSHLVQIALSVQQPSQASLSAPQLLRVSHLLRNSTKYEGQFAVYKVQLYSMESAAQTKTMDNVKEEEESKQKSPGWTHVSNLKIALARRQGTYFLELEIPEGSEVNYPSSLALNSEIKISMEECSLKQLGQEASCQKLIVLQFQQESDFVAIDEVKKPAPKYLIEVDQAEDTPPSLSTFLPAPSHISQKVGLMPVDQSLTAPLQVSEFKNQLFYGLRLCRYENTALRSQQGLAHLSASDEELRLVVGSHF